MSRGVDRNHSVKRQICPGVWFCPVCSQRHWEVEVIKWIVEKELSSYSMKEEPGERQDWRRGNQNRL